MVVLKSEGYLERCFQCGGFGHNILVCPNCEFVTLNDVVGVAKIVKPRPTQTTMAQGPKPEPVVDGSKLQEFHTKMHFTWTSLQGCDQPRELIKFRFP